MSSREKRSDKEVLQAAIQKAIDSGLKAEYIAKDEIRIWYSKPCEDGIELGLTDIPLRYVIFNHDFAKALWGMNPHHWQTFGRPTQSFDGEVYEYDMELDEFGALPCYMHHLQQLAIADDRIDYLRRNI